MNSVLAVSSVLVVLLLTARVSSEAQAARGRTHRGTQGTATTLPDSGSEIVLPSFDGRVRGLDPKLLTIERPDSNTMEFHCSKKTRYYDGSREIKADAIKSGDSVLVDAKRAPDGSLEAVRVRIERPKSSS